jgi:hypothetical protein
LVVIKIERCGLGVKRVVGIRIEQQLRQKDSEHVSEVEQGTPSLVQDVQAHRSTVFIYIRVEDAGVKTN